MHAVVVYGHAIGTINCLTAGRYDRQCSSNAILANDFTRLAFYSTRIHSHIVFISLLLLCVRDTFEGSSWDSHGHVKARNDTGEIAFNSFRYDTVHSTSSAIN